MDLKKAIKDIEPDIYEESGRQYMFNNARSYMQQKSSVHLTNTHMNRFQHLSKGIFDVNSQRLMNTHLSEDSSGDRSQHLTNTHLSKDIFDGAEI